MRTLSKTLMVGLLVVAASSAFAQDARNERVRVYTNADIAKLSPIPQQSAPVVEFDYEGWNYVSAMVEQGWARVAAEREWQLRRRIAEADIAEKYAYARRDTYGLAYAPWGFFPVGVVDDGPSVPGAGQPTPVPLHAQPNLAQQRMRIDGARSGADAVPSR